MKHFKKFSTLLFGVALYGTCFGQIRSMGFTQKVSGLTGSMYHVYYPKLHVINDTLFVCSVTGVYQKDVLRDSEWELYAFEDVPVIEFVKNGNNVLANAFSTTDGRDSLLLISYDNGKSYEDYTSADLLEYGENHLFRISQNPQNPNSILLLTSCYGLYRSNNYGKKWQNLYPYSLGIDVAFASFHPLDTTAIYYCGEGAIHNGVIYKTCDSGKTWTDYEVPGGDNCVHQIDFHPSNPNILVWGGEGKIGKSTDKGETWNVTDLYDTGMYFYKVLFDKENPDILYASGPNGRYHGDDQDTIWVYRSTDTGETWHLAYKEYLGANGGGVIDMVKYKDRLIFYTRELGILELDVKTTPVVSGCQSIGRKDGLTVYPNPVKETLHFQTDNPINRIDIIDIAGRIVQKSFLYGGENAVDVSPLNAGIYSVVFHTGEQSIIRKICIGH